MDASPNHPGEDPNALSAVGPLVAQEVAGTAVGAPDREPSKSENVLAAPVRQADRIKLIDMLRGVALLGILLMNIPFFSMPNYFDEVFRSNPKDGNFWLMGFIAVFFEGKMRALFGMVFGAGVLLFIRNKEATGKPVHGLFYRRMFWLVLFGLVHAHLVLWWGDILYLYGVCGMIVYLFRNMRPKYLVLAVPLVALLDFGGNTLLYRSIRNTRLVYLDAVKAQQAGATLTAAQTNALSAWREVEKTILPNRNDAEENKWKMKSDYGTVAKRVRRLAFEFETKFLLPSLSDSVALMLFGMALLRLGFLTGEWSTQTYRRVALLGYGLGLPLVLYSGYFTVVHFPNHEAVLEYMAKAPVIWIQLIYPFQRILLVMAHVSLLVLLYRSGTVQWLLGRLAAVGQMAFTNYIMHSVICTLFFFGYGLNFYAELKYYQIYLFVLGIWIFQLAVSPMWLKYFLFGPLEWLWRTLTYLRIQPMRRV